MKPNIKLISLNVNKLVLEGTKTNYLRMKKELVIKKPSLLNATHKWAVSNLFIL